MTVNGFSQARIRRIGRVLLAVFMLSWLNLAFQVPVHAAMVESQSLSQEMVMNCQCPPSLNEAVLSAENQSLDGVQLISLSVLTFQAVFSDTIDSSLVDHQLMQKALHSDQTFRDTRPPPLLLNTRLLI